jgi:hypothetical protein
LQCGDLLPLWPGQVESRFVVIGKRRSAAAKRSVAGQSADRSAHCKERPSFRFRAECVAVVVCFCFDAGYVVELLVRWPRPAAR